MNDIRRHRLALLLALSVLLVNSLSPRLFCQVTESQPIGGSSAVAANGIKLPALRPVTALTGRDNPNDDGGQISLLWKASPDDTAGGIITGYHVLKATSPSGPFQETGDISPGATSFIGGETKDGQAYYFKVVALGSVPGSDGATLELTADSDVFGPVESSAQWFHTERLNVLVATAVTIFLIMFMIQRAKKGGKLYIRKIAGLDAVDDAIGRATEMGKKVIYVPGIDDMDNVMTIASMIILGYVAEKTATYNTYLEVPVCKSMVMVTAKEVVKEAYTKVGRADSYRTEQVHYLTEDQFGYAAAIDGIVVREKPATMFYIGSFYAESLILAEIGNAAGAIQIAGTAQPTQLPFFVTACDYTLLGEEMFAASAYLSKEPRLLGSLKGQDYVKALVLASIVIGIILETFGIWDFSSLFTVV